MGMSGDYETAIAFGATHVRVGSAIFGEPELTHVEIRFGSGKSEDFPHRREVTATQPAVGAKSGERCGRRWRTRRRAGDGSG